MSTINLYRAAVYDPETGIIARIVTGSVLELPLQTRQGEQWLLSETANDATDYVDGRTVKPRPACPATLDGMTLRNLPLPCTVIVAGDMHDVPAGGDDFAELEFTYPGTYQVQVVGAWPYLDGEFTVVQP